MLIGTINNRFTIDSIDTTAFDFCTKTHAIPSIGQVIGAAVKGATLDQRGLEAVYSQDISAFECNGLGDILFTNGFENK